MDAKSSLKQRYKSASNKEKLVMCKDLQSIKIIRLLRKSRSGDLQEQRKVAVS